MVCERVIIINKGEIVAVDTPKNLAMNMTSTECFQARIKGPSEQIADVIRKIDGVIKVDGIRPKDDIGAGFSDFIIENKKSIDVRTPLFFKMAEKGYAIHELKSVNLSLEEIFLQLTAEENRNLEV